MRILEFALDGNGIWPDVRARDLSDRLTAFLGPTASGKSTIAGLLAHVLYGQVPGPGVAARDRYPAQPEGELIVDDQGDRYRLRRYNDVAPPGRLTVSSLDGARLDEKTVENLLSGISSVVLSEIYAVNVTSERGLEQLLSEQFAEHFRDSATAINKRTGEPDTADYRSDYAELINRRDELARELQVRVAEQRQRSHELDDQLQELDSLQKKQVSEIAEFNRQLQSVHIALAEVEARLRYDRFETALGRQPTPAVPADFDMRLEELDAQIQLWRSTLVNMSQREESIRDRLAETHPDDTTTWVPLANQRTHLGVLQRLATDLNGELAKLARSAESEVCVCREAHPRLRPLAEALGRHIEHLDQSIGDQERAISHQELSDEARQLAKARVEIRDQLQLLLDRRQSLNRLDHPTHHQRPDKSAQATALPAGNLDNVPPDQLEVTRKKLEQEQSELRQQLTRHQEARKSTELQRIRVAKDHVSLLSGVPLEQVCSELAALQAKLNQQVAPAGGKATVPPDPPTQPTASDYLAKFSSGGFLQMQIDPQTGRLTVISSENHRLSIDSLEPAERDLVYLSLILSLATDQRKQGVHLPLVLDEPFARMNEHQAVATASVLDDFARAGNQVLVFTGRADAVEQFRSAGQTVVEMRQLHCASDTDVELLREEKPVVDSANSKVEDRFTDEPGFLLGIDHPISRFPALGRNTDSAFTAIGIHTVGDLIEAGPAEIAGELAMDHITNEIVRLWQTHQVLMCFIPNVTLNDAQLMTGVGVSSPDHFVDLDADSLLHRIESFLNSKRGKRLVACGLDFHRDLVHQWIEGAAKYRLRWQNSVAGQRWRDRREKHVASQEVDPLSQQDCTGSDPSGKAGSQKSPDFYLELTSDIQQAPSIGPKTTARLQAIGIAQVADFLNADPVETARRLKTRHLKASKLTNWQHQARLMCQVPGLQVCSAQILVGCNLTDPTQIAQMKPEDLLDWITPFCDTKEGERILRGDTPPGLGEVTRWIEWAGEYRILEAA